MMYVSAKRRKQHGRSPASIAARHAKSVAKLAERGLTPAQIIEKHTSMPLFIQRSLCFCILMIYCQDITPSPITLSCILPRFARGKASSASSLVFPFLTTRWMSCLLPLSRTTSLSTCRSLSLDGLSTWCAGSITSWG